jgi:DNA replication protein DnaC
MDAFAFDAVPMISKAQMLAICSGDGWLDKGANLILFGPPGGGKSRCPLAMPQHARDPAGMDQERRWPKNE